jgi:hypothetical protein
VPTSIAWELQSGISYYSPPPDREILLIAQPISKVDTLDHARSPFVALDESERLDSVFDIAMAPILALDGRYRSDIY